MTLMPDSIWILLAESSVSYFLDLSSIAFLVAKDSADTSVRQDCLLSCSLYFLRAIPSLGIIPVSQWFTNMKCFPMLYFIQTFCGHFFCLQPISVFLENMKYTPPFLLSYFNYLYLFSTRKESDFYWKAEKKSKHLCTYWINVWDL